MDEKLTKDQRRKKAIEGGRKFESIICPLCLRARVGSVWRGKYIFKIDSNPEVIQVRYHLGGKGTGGFFKNEQESIRLDILRERRPDVWKNLKIEINKLNNLFGEIEYK